MLTHYEIIRINKNDTLENFQNYLLKFVVQSRNSTEYYLISDTFGNDDEYAQDYKDFKAYIESL